MEKKAENKEERKEMEDVGKDRKEGDRKRNNGVEKEIIMLGRKGGRNEDV